MTLLEKIKVTREILENTPKREGKLLHLDNSSNETLNNISNETINNNEFPFYLNDIIAFKDYYGNTIEISIFADFCHNLQRNGLLDDFFENELTNYLSDFFEIDLEIERIVRVNSNTKYKTLIITVDDTIDNCSWGA